jgi:phosphoribosylamine--glycine ligase
MVAGGLSSSDVRFERKATVCKYLVPDGYPEAPRAGEDVVLRDSAGAILYMANIEEREGKFFTQTSRTLAFVGVGDSLEEAERTAEAAASSVGGSVWHRRDIGTREMLDKRIAHMQELR